MRIDQTAISLVCDGKSVCLDMHDIDTELLPTKEDMLVLLRNLDARADDVKLDFSKCSYEDKAEWLKLYATTAAKTEISELAKAWTDIVHAMLSQQMSDVKCYMLDEEELKTFVKDNISLCADVAQLLHDSMLWATAVAASKKETYKADEVKHLSANILFCCKHIHEFDFDLHSAFKTCKSWPAVFVPENFQMMKDMLQTSRCCMMLYGQHTPQWEIFCKIMNQII